MVSSDFKSILGASLKNLHWLLCCKRSKLQQKFTPMSRPVQHERNTLSTAV